MQEQWYWNIEYWCQSDDSDKHIITGSSIGINSKGQEHMLIVNGSATFQGSVFAQIALWSSST